METRSEQGRAPVKAWVDGVPVEEEVWQQIRGVASLPFIYRHVAVMPDCHVGKGSTVGTVIATQAAIVPAAVGVDLGCGMIAQRLKHFWETIDHEMRVLAQWGPRS